MRTTSHVYALAVLAGAALFSARANADFLINDDLIVQGSTCIGLDCVNNMAFGFDTLVLRENNLRIFFDDTSVSAGFPANKWRITVNDSASGGSSFFAIDDVTGNRTGVFRVQAGAPSASLHIASSGNVGIGTTVPGLDLDIFSGDTPAIRLEQSGSQGFTAQTWDIGGNEANFFVRDVTGGSRLPFRVRPGAPTSSIDIAGSGFVGVGTASPGAPLDVNVSSGSANVLISRGGVAQPVNANAFSEIVASNGTTRQAAQFRTTTNGAFDIVTAATPGTFGTVRMNIGTTGNVGIGFNSTGPKLDVNGTIRAVTLTANPAGNTMCFDGSNIFGFCSSDIHLKRDVQYLPDNAGLAAVMQLKPAAFRWQDGDDRQMAGFIAQDTQRAIPAAVHKPVGAEYLSLDSTAVLAYTVKAVQELKAENESLRAEIERLKAAR